MAAALRGLTRTNWLLSFALMSDPGRSDTAFRSFRHSLAIRTMRFSPS